ncbi:MAG: hypothetical protein ACKOWF_04505 [Chloroflexota bacterium]
MGHLSWTRPVARPAIRGLAFAALAVAALAAAFSPVSLARQNDADDLVGVYSASIAKPDLPPALPGQAALLGTWAVTFNADGSYTLDRQDVGVVVSGSYEVDGSTLSIADWQGLIWCGDPGSDRLPATYAWRRSGDGIVLTAITDACEERRILLQSHPLMGFQACGIPADGARPGVAAASPVPDSGATSGLTAQEGLPRGETTEKAIDSLLAQATGCWATGDPARFLALHSSDALADISSVAPLSEFSRDLRLFMSTPLAFQRVGEVTETDPDRAWAYVEITLGGQPIPQRLDFVREDGVWLFDVFFLFGPEAAAADAGAPAP